MTFTPEVYEQIREGARRSAEAIVPRVVSLLDPGSVLDVGCGEGMFAREFARSGCAVTAIDESCEGIRVVAEEDWAPSGFVDFRHADLERDRWPSLLSELAEDGKDRRPSVGESGFPFDLVVCLEVAEHLPASYADALVSSLCSLAPVVLFSAAVPGQGGHGHLNEQWPRYWAERFEEEGRMVSGALRWQFWGNDAVEPWYQQNLLLAATSVAVADLEERGDPESGIAAAAFGCDLFSDAPWADAISVVHPTTFSYWVEIAKSRR